MMAQSSRSWGWNSGISVLDLRSVFFASNVLASWLADIPWCLKSKYLNNAKAALMHLLYLCHPGLDQSLLRSSCVYSTCTLCPFDMTSITHSSSVHHHVSPAEALGMMQEVQEVISIRVLEHD